LKNKFFLCLSAVPFFLPLSWRLLDQGLAQPLGLVSDGAIGLLFWVAFLPASGWMRAALVGIWTLFHLSSLELFVAMQRFPSREDVQYLFNPEFLKNATSGFDFLSPLKSGSLLIAALLCILLPVPRIAWRSLRYVVVLVPLTFATHWVLDREAADSSVAARYSALHWFVGDVVAEVLHPTSMALGESDLPEGLRQVDLGGSPLLSKGRAKNVLIVVLEGITGFYHPEIRRAMGIESDALAMDALAVNTESAMLIPDFVTHASQTIRGLYAILCGDFSKLSSKTPKAFELTSGLNRSASCLPAQMAENGWSTHYLQGAGLAFMGKDRVMPAIGFQEVHGSEWFSEADPYPFEWGVSDPAFFKGARRYIGDLRKRGDPWMLTLLTVGTHQPYADASEAVAARYPNRRDASVAMLDGALAGFLAGLADDGVLKDTLVLITCDESHGFPLADWISSWGTGILMVPEQHLLPRIKRGTYGLVDVSASILDYFGLPMPPAIVGRSFFRDYTGLREMVSYSGGKLRWHTSGNLRYECTKGSSRCRVGVASSLLGFPRTPLELEEQETAPLLFARAAVLDNRLIPKGSPQSMRFATGEIRRLPEKVVNEWSENIVGAQYLDFPERSKVHVSIRVKAVKAGDDGIQLKLNLREYEHLVTNIDYPSFPLLHAGDVTEIAFDFDNPRTRRAFSFHLFGEGANAIVQVEEFSVTVDRSDS